MSTRIPEPLRTQIDATDRDVPCAPTATNPIGSFAFVCERD